MLHIKTITGIIAMLVSVTIGRDPWPWALLFAAGVCLVALGAEELDEKDRPRRSKRR